jgi:tetratricopeptide (TPR) repeat protein
MDLMPQVRTSTRALTGALLVAAVVCGGLLLVCGGCRKAPETPLDKALLETKRHPTSGPAFIALGDVYYDSKAYNDAFVAYKRALEINANDADAAFKLARTDLYLGDADHGIVMALQALKGNPNNKEAHLVLGRHYLSKRDADKASTELRRLLDMDPKYTEARLYLVTADLMQNDDKGALDEARQAAVTDPGNAKARATYAAMLQHFKQTDQAVNEYRAAVKLDSNDVSSMMQLATILAQQERNLDEARTLAKRASEIAPADGFPAALASWILYRQGKPTEALREMDVAARANPYNHRILLLYARMLKEQNFSDQAEAVMRHAMAVAPRIPLTPEQRKQMEEASSKSKSGADRKSTRLNSSHT